MLKEHYYEIGGFTFGVCLPGTCDADGLLPSFLPFRCSQETRGEWLFYFVGVSEHSVAMSSPFPADRIFRVLEETSAGGFRVQLALLYDGGYRVEVRTAAGRRHALRTDRRFAYVTACMEWADPFAGDALSLLLRLAFSQAVLSRGGVLVHAAAVALDSRAYLFMGKSGTGKSTHALLWTAVFPDCFLLNDDNPLVRIGPEEIVACGTPWSGKTPCYRNERFPVGGIVRLAQAGANRFSLQEDVEAFVALLPGCAVFPESPGLHEALCDTLVALASRVPVGFLECLPNGEAARLCADSLRRAQPAAGNAGYRK